MPISASSLGRTSRENSAVTRWLSRCAVRPSRSPQIRPSPVSASSRPYTRTRCTSSSSERSPGSERKTAGSTRGMRARGPLRFNLRAAHSSRLFSSLDFRSVRWSGLSMVRTRSGPRKLQVEPVLATVPG